MSRKKNFPESHILNPLLIKLVSVKMAGYWPRSIFCKFMDLDSASVHKHAKKYLANIYHLLTKSEVITGKSQTEALMYLLTER